MNSPITNRIAAPLNYNGLPRRSYWRFSVVAVMEIVARSGLSDGAIFGKKY